VDTKVLNDRLTLIGNLGVVIGLAILIIEVNQANRLAETQAVAFRLDQMQHAQLAFSESDYLPQIELKYLAEGVQSLSALEIARLARWEESVSLRMQSHLTNSSYDWSKKQPQISNLTRTLLRTVFCQLRLLLAESGHQKC
jgi:hypothetical protein